MNDFDDDNTQPCWPCDGTGTGPDNRPCLACDGLGWVENCPSCHGTGALPDGSLCGPCGGTGLEHWEAEHWCANCSTPLDMADTNDEICRRCLTELDIDPNPAPYNTGPDPDPTPGALARALAADWAEHPDPVRQLHAARQLTNLLNRHRWHRILRARMNSATWTRIADAIGDTELGALLDYLHDTDHFPHDARTFLGRHLWWALDETHHPATTETLPTRPAAGTTVEEAADA